MHEQDQFQSLIGRLKTREQVEDIVDKLKFQSLIGRLKTGNSRGGDMDMMVVSIPHR